MGLGFETRVLKKSCWRLKIPLDSYKLVLGKINSRKLEKVNIKKDKYVRRKGKKSMTIQKDIYSKEIQHRKWKDNHRNTTTCVFKMQSPWEEKANDTIMPFTLAS